MTTNIDQARRGLDALRELTTVLAEQPSGRVLSVYANYYRDHSVIAVTLESMDDARRVAAALELEPMVEGKDGDWFGKFPDGLVGVTVMPGQPVEHDKHSDELASLALDLEPAAGSGE